MRHMILAVGLMLALALTWANIGLAQPEASLAEGEALVAAGDIEAALAHYQQVTRSHPDSYQAHARLGGMQLANQHYADAVRSFQQAVSLGDTGTGSFIGMGTAYLHMGQLGPARAAFVEARARGVKHPEDIDGVIGWIDQRLEAMPSTDL